MKNERWPRRWKIGKTHAGWVFRVLETWDTSTSHDVDVWEDM